MSVSVLLFLGFALGMRHATDADHVVAVSTIVSRARSFRAAAPIGALWGVGHTLTMLLVGSAILALGVTISPRLGLGMELSVGIMLVALGAFNIVAALRKDRGHTHLIASPRSNAFRPLAVGVVHGLAGSAAITLLVLGAVHDVSSGVLYLLVFGVGTIGGMFLVTLAMAFPIAKIAHRFARLHDVLAITTGAGSVAFGMWLVYQIGFVHGLFTSHPQWTPS